MIIKELLSEVLGLSIDTVDFEQDNKVYFKYTEYDGIRINNMSIYELAYKCKEWAFEKNYWLPSNINSQGGFCQVNYKGKIYQFQADTEPQAVFKACEWILKEIK